MPLRMEVDLRAGHIVLDGFKIPALRERRTASPSFRPMSIVATVGGRPSHLPLKLISLQFNFFFKFE